ncbi:hypothetical protein ACTXJE_12485 [Glutamicibacter ardleyensis]
MNQPVQCKTTFSQPGEESPTRSTARRSIFAGTSPVLSPAVNEQKIMENKIHDYLVESIDDVRASEEGASMLYSSADLLERAGTGSFAKEARDGAEAIERIAKRFPEADLAERGDAGHGDAGIAENVRELRLALGVDH